MYFLPRSVEMAGLDRAIMAAAGTTRSAAYLTEIRLSDESLASFTAL